MTATYSYGGGGDRVKKTSSLGTSIYPFGDDYEITGGVTTKYIPVAGLGVVAKRVGTGGSAVTYWLHTDRLGSIQAVTNTAGTAVFRRQYRPSGETLAQTGSHTESRGWIDQRNDGENGLTYLHARYFDPQLGVFVSPDPIGVQGGASQYTYGTGDPANRMDRSGLLAQAPVIVCYEDANGQVRCVDVGGGTTSGGGDSGGGSKGGGAGGGTDGGGGTTCQSLKSPCDDDGFGGGGVPAPEPEPEPGCAPGDPKCSGEPPACEAGDPLCDPAEPEPTETPKPVQWWREFFKAMPGSVCPGFGQRYVEDLKMTAGFARSAAGTAARVAVGAVVGIRVGQALGSPGPMGAFYSGMRSTIFGPATNPASLGVAAGFADALVAATAPEAIAAFAASSLATTGTLLGGVAAGTAIEAGLGTCF